MLSFSLSSLLTVRGKTWGVQRQCPVLCLCMGVGEGGGLALQSCITVVMGRLAVSLIPQQHPALTRPLNKAFDPPAAAAEKVTACLWLPCLSVCIHGQEAPPPPPHSDVHIQIQVPSLPQSLHSNFALNPFFHYIPLPKPLLVSIPSFLSLLEGSDGKTTTNWPSYSFSHC